MKEAAEAILDMGVSLPLLSIGIPFRKSPLVIRLTMTRPRLGGQIRVAKKFLELGVTYQEIEGFSDSEATAFVATKGHIISEMIALCIVGGKYTGLVAMKPLAALIRWCCTPQIIQGALMQYLRLMGTQSFTTFIKYMELTQPMQMSQQQQGS